VLVTGAPHETSALYATIEAAGCVVVGEDHDWGDPWVGMMLDESLDPFEALAVRWETPLPGAPTGSSQPAPRRWPIAPPRWTSRP
jgi:hypothetical protein